MRAALAELPEHCSEILDRFFARDESYATIGAALEIPQGTIASRISRCLGKLREKLEHEGRSAASDSVWWEMNEERIAELLAELPPAPGAWVRAAQELPRARREIERLVSLAEADAAYRVALLADTTAALRGAGLEPAPRVVAQLRERLRQH